MKDKILLVDGHSILNRAFYGIPLLTNSEGLHTNAIYGFINILLKTIQEEKSEYVAVAFDVSKPTFRHKQYKEYKGTRKGMPTELREQVPIMKEVLDAMGISIFECPGFEADDVLGSIAKHCEGKGFNVSILSGDRDLLQLATEDIKIRIPKTKKGQGTEIEDYNINEVIEKYQVTPTEFIDVKGLMGDASDNIPGVPGIGEKTAIKIIKQYGSIENAYVHVDELKPPRASKNLKEFYDQAILSKELATIKVDMDLNFKVKDVKLSNIYNEQSYSYFKRLDFKKLLGRFDNNVDYNQDESINTKQFIKVSTRDELDRIVGTINELEYYSIYLVGDKELTGISISIDDSKTYYITQGDNLDINYIANTVIDLLRGVKENQTIIVHNLKQQLNLLINAFDIIDINKLFDTQLAGYLCNPLKDTYNYDDLAKDYLDINVPSEEEILGKGKSKLSLEELDDEKITHFICYHANISYKAYTVLKDKLKQMRMYDLFINIEMPLIMTLVEMENNGIKVDGKALEAYGNKLKDRIDTLEDEIYNYSGEKFNINSPKQLGVILFERLELPIIKKTKTGYSTAQDVLEKLADKHPIINLITEYRHLVKLKSTYADGLADYIQEDSRIHGKFNQTITATGRISSTEPNLQNIPIRLELGREIRKVFIPEDDYVFIDADYSQIELRLLAVLSEDDQLINAYNNNQDIHRLTASQVFHVPFDEVTSEQRSNAKAVNFGIVYGISAFGLSQDLNITRKEADEYIKNYFSKYPTIKLYLDNCVRLAKERGYAVTMFDRRRPIPEIQSSNFMQRSFGERVAMNSPIQGSAADVIKIAMIKVFKKLKDKKLKSRLILQIHDELLIEAHKDEVDIVKKILQEEMENAIELDVPLEIDMHQGYSWYETK